MVDNTHSAVPAVVELNLGRRQNLKRYTQMILGALLPQFHAPKVTTKHTLNEKRLAHLYIMPCLPHLLDEPHTTLGENHAYNGLHLCGSKVLSSNKLLIFHLGAPSGHDNKIVSIPPLNNNCHFIKHLFIKELFPPLHSAQSHRDPHDRGHPHSSIVKAFSLHSQPICLHFGIEALHHQLNHEDCLQIPSTLEHAGHQSMRPHAACTSLELNESCRHFIVFVHQLPIFHPSLGQKAIEFVGVGHFAKGETVAHRGNCLFRYTGSSQRQGQQLLAAISHPRHGRVRQLRIVREGKYTETNHSVNLTNRQKHVVR